MNRFERHSQLLIGLIASLLSAFVAGCGAGNDGRPSILGGPGIVAVVIKPTVTFTVPANLATGVAINSKVTATFSTAMDPATISGTSFTLSGPGATPVAGTVTYAATGITASFAPASNLAANTVYTATITTAATDLAGSALANNFVWSFATSATPDTTAPLLSLTAPANAVTGAPINTKITATFNESMDPATISGTSFTLTGPGATPVAGTVTYAAAGITATFTPASNLAPGTVYTATVTTAVTDLAGNALASGPVPNPWTFTTGLAPDTTAPRLNSTNPADLAATVAVTQAITATFSEAMNSATITGTSFTLTGPGATAVAGTVTYAAAGTTATFTPTGNLAASTVYTATITTAATDLAGNALASGPVPNPWTFTTAPTPDTTAPSVISTNPVAVGTNVAVAQAITATFSEAMNPATITGASFTLTGPGATAVAGTVTYAAAGTSATFTPTSNLAANTVYTATITTAATDVAGNALAGGPVPNPWTFTTAPSPDTTAPRVNVTAPANAATGVAINSKVTATFNEAMNPATISGTSFTLTGPGATVVGGTVTYAAAGTTATFTPASNLAFSTVYTATVTTAATDVAGNALASGPVPNPWTFTTVPAPVVPPLIDLGSATPFGTFGGSAGMTNQGDLTVINGDIGTKAIGTTSITGFHDSPPSDSYTETCPTGGAAVGCGRVNGKIYTCTNSTTGPTSSGPNAASCAIATQADADAQTAYAALVAKAGGPDPSVAGNLANLVLTPGTYTIATAFRIQGGNLTLDALGDANASWVFQMGTSLTVGGPGATLPQSVLLVNGAQARNVYWQVGSAATINAAGGGTMAGTIISQTGAVFSTAGNLTIVTLNGRVLSLGPSVTMVNTVINVPAP